MREQKRGEGKDLKEIRFAKESGMHLNGNDGRERDEARERERWSDMAYSSSGV